MSEIATFPASLAALPPWVVADAIKHDRIRRNAEENLVDFIKLFWGVVEPGRQFVGNWHIDRIAEHLEAVSRGEIRDLLVNIPPGPMRYDSLVETARGAVALETVRVGDRVLSHRGRYCEVTEVHEQGVLPILRIVTQAGRIVRAAPTHPFLTPHGWVQVKDLRLGDTLAAIHPEDPGCRGERSSVTPEEARLMGYMVGDGSLTQATPMFTNMDIDVVEDFIACCKSVGLSVSRTVRKRAHIIRVLGGRRAHSVFGRFGIYGCDSYEKRVPEEIRNGPPEILRNFIGAYWACDGTFDVRTTRARGSMYRTTCTSVNRQLVEDLQHMLGVLGVPSRVRERSRAEETVAQPGGTYRFYMLNIQNEQGAAELASFPGLGERKAALAKLCRKGFSSVITPDEIVSIEPEDPARCLCLTVDGDSSFTCSGLAVHNCAKSLIISVFFPAWEWLQDGAARFLGASYGEELAVRDSTKCRDIIMSEDYQRYWPHIKPKSGQDQKLKYTLETGGWRLATSVGGRATGEHPTYKLVDDPHSALQALSDAERGRANTWFKETLSSRGAALNAATIVVMQRLHQDDTSGLILEQLGGYTHLCLPMRYDPAHPHVSAEDPRTRKGELLWPEMFDEEKVLVLEKRLGEYGASGQLQQLPNPPGGGILKTENIGMWSADTPLPPFQFILLSLDTAFTEKTSGDPTACTALGVFSWKNRQCVMLLDCWTEHLGYPQLRAKVISEWSSTFGGVKDDPLNKPRRPDLLLIEEKGSGISLLQDLRSANIGARKYNPGKMDKLARAHQFAPMLEMGVFYIPESRKNRGQFISWAEPLVTQLEKFPNATHDDLVDTITQGFIYLRDSQLLELPYVEAIDDEQEFDYHARQDMARNPYAA